MGNFDGHGEVQISSRRRRFGSSGLGAGAGEGIRVGPSPCGLCQGDALQLPKEDLAGAMWVRRVPEASAVCRMCGRAIANHHGHLARIQVKLLAAAHCVAGCTE